jgi:hypothetical protein
MDWGLGSEAKHASSLRRRVYKASTSKASLRMRRQPLRREHLKYVVAVNEADLGKKEL